MKTVLEAYTFAAEAHKGQKRKDGSDFITHPETVSELVERNRALYLTGRLVSFTPDDLRIIALLHDTVEDTTVTNAKIEKEFGPSIASAVNWLTKRDDESYFDYLINIVEHASIEIKLIKMMDIQHNLLTWPTSKGSMVDKWCLSRYLLEKTL